jgi:hypothetical protein
MYIMNLDVNQEEYDHIILRRAAIKQFHKFITSTVPKDQERIEADERLQSRLEQELASKWGYYV